jgi:hypothetical protein
MSEPEFKRPDRLAFVSGVFKVFADVLSCNAFSQLVWSASATWLMMLSE